MTLARLLAPLSLLGLLAACPAWNPFAVDDPDDVELSACPVAGTCSLDRDCGAGQRCDFATVADGEPCGVCVAVLCFGDADCDDGDVCDTTRERCERPLFCDAAAPRAGCDDGALCLVDGDGGACRAAPAAARCELVPALAVTTSGAVARFDGVAVDGEGNLVPRSDGPLDDARTCDGPAPCDNNVIVDVGDVDCAGRWVVLPPRAPDTTRVLVVDAEDGTPLSAVSVSSSADNAVVTDALGVAVLPAGVSFVRAAVDDGHHAALTLLGPTGDVVLPLRRAGSQAAGGTLATPVVDDVTMGLGGLSLGDVDDADVAGLLGASGRITVTIDDVTDADGVEVPFSSGGILGIGDIRGELGLVLRDRFVAWARPGARLLWSLGAGTPLTKFAELVTNQRQAGTDLRLEMLRLMAPNARAGADARVSAEDADFPRGRNNDLDALSVTNPGAWDATVDVSADVDVAVGALPPLTTDVILLVGAVVRGRGLVLLGGKVARAVVPANVDNARIEVPGVVRVPFAPPHAGLEGRSLVLVAVPLDVDALKADDHFGAARAVVPLPAPSPGRALSATLPALDRAPRAHVDGAGVLVVDDVGDADRLRLTVHAPAGDEQLWLPATTGAVDVAAVDPGVDLDGATLAAVRFADDPFVRFVTPWESTASMQGVPLP